MMNVMVYPFCFSPLIVMFSFLCVISLETAEDLFPMHSKIFPMRLKIYMFLNNWFHGSNSYSFFFHRVSGRLILIDGNLQMKGF